MMLGSVISGTSIFPSSTALIPRNARVVLQDVSQTARLGFTEMIVDRPGSSTLAWAKPLLRTPSLKQVLYNHCVQG